MTVLLAIQHVTYAYPAVKTPNAALRDVSLQIQEGEYVVVLGHNGSGKSTLARLCNALLLPDEGNVLIGGMDTHDVAKRRSIRDMVGIIFQNPDNQIIATLVEDDIAWSLAIQGFAPELIAERVEDALIAVGIAALRQLPPHKLSGGQRQRVAIAGILALRPRCIIADEATSMLDPLARQEITGLLHHLNKEQGLTILQVTHLLEEAALADRVVVMEQGQIVVDEPPAKFFANVRRLHSLRLALPEPIEFAERLRNLGYSIAENALTIEAIVQELY